MVPSGDHSTRRLPGSDAISLTKRATIFVESPSTGLTQRQSPVRFFRSQCAFRKPDRIVTARRGKHDPCRSGYRRERTVPQEYQQSQPIDAPPAEVFAWLSDVGNLPEYLPPWWPP